MATYTYIGIIMRRFMFCATLVVLLVGCTNGFEDSRYSPDQVTTLPDLTAEFADAKDDTRTYIDGDNHLHWHKADLITAFFGNTLNQAYRFNGETGDNSGTFSLVPSGMLGTGNDLEAIYAVYPHNKAVKISDTGVLSLTLPSMQGYAEGTFGKGANTMIAVTESVADTYLGFRNAGGYLKVQLYGEDVTVRSVVLRGNNDERIAGAATVVMEHGGLPEVTMADDAETYVSINCGDGVKLGTTPETATEFWFVIPEVTFENGFTIVVNDTNFGRFEKSTSRSVTIDRNTIQPMKAIAVDITAGVPPLNEVWYTSTDGQIVEINISDDYYNGRHWGGWGYSYGSYNTRYNPLVSNTYVDGVGRLVFEDTVTNIPNNAFGSNLASVVLPNGVIQIENYAFENLKIKELHIPESVELIGSMICMGSDNLEKVTGRWTSEDGSYIYHNERFVCYAPSHPNTEFVVPDTFTEIESYAFYHARNLKRVVIPESVEVIGQSSFLGATALETVNVPSKVTSLYDNFRNCYSLKNVTLSYGLQEIKYETFAECTSLKSITIPASVTVMYNDVLHGCSSLEALYMESATPTECDPYSSRYYFGNSANLKIYVPNGSVDAYKSAEPWKYYADNIVGYSPIANFVVDGVDYGKGVRIDNTVWAPTNLYVPTAEFPNHFIHPGNSYYDKCPDGWRAPTRKEMEALIQNHSEWNSGYYFSGSRPYSKGVPSIFLGARGLCNLKSVYYTGERGYYWVSDSVGAYGGVTLEFYDSYIYFSGQNAFDYYCSLRCVQEE